MCCSLSLLSNITKLSKPVSLSLPNGLVLLVKNISTSYLDNVFFVPSFNYNLLSVSKWIFVTEGTISFYSDHCDFRASHSQDVLAHGRMISKLYHLEFYKDFSSTLFSMVNSVVSKHKLSALWHMRLGHASSQMLHKIPMIGSNIIDDSNHQCPICPLSKQTNMPFPLSTSMLLTVLI